MSREIRKLIKKVDELQRQLNLQSGYILEQTLTIQKLMEKLVVIPSYPYTPSIDPHFGKDIPYVPYKGPDCADNTKVANVQKVNMYGEVIPQYPFDTSS
ncbi:hypothetical protein UFOVP760_10 [uncultured Caudovirales phage]|uniref:Uncharacterized protein n=1 Tax=uncultured Caudovirales phage TaxID=2100421 RepID=A0A6J7X9A6_9CAUD|nr:hypothetical protein UFOVP760_10 [uncultured Caudovirales phage]